MNSQSTGWRYVLAAVLLAFLIWVIGVYTERVPSKNIPKDALGPFRVGERIIILGIPMSGKTTLAATLTKSVKRIVYFDPFHDYAEIANAKAVKASELFKNPKILDQSEFRYAIQPDDTGDLAQDFDDTVMLVRAAGDMVFVMDEIGDYKRETEQTLAKIARNIRHNGIVPIFVSQVATDIPKTVRRLATAVYSFRQEHPDDLEALEKVYGEAFAQEVSQLPEHEYALWTLKGFKDLGHSAKHVPQRRQFQSGEDSQQSKTLPLRMVPKSSA